MNMHSVPVLQSPTATESRPQRCIGCPLSDAHGLFETSPHSMPKCYFDNVAVEEHEAIPASYDKHPGIAVVRRGLIVRQREDSNGNATAVDVVGPGQAFRTGVAPSDSNDGGDTVTGYAVERALLCMYSKPELPQTDVSSQMYHLMMQSIDRMERFIVARARATSESRVASLLCALQDSLGPRRQGRIPASLRQQDMASLLFLRHESVCRALRSLREGGLVSCDADGIRIIDRVALQQV